MKKYKVLTNNLNWLAIFKDYIIQECGSTIYGNWWDIYDLDDNLYTKMEGFSHIIEMNPDWFEEIK